MRLRNCAAALTPTRGASISSPALLALATQRVLWNCGPPVTVTANTFSSRCSSAKRGLGTNRIHGLPGHDGLGTCRARLLHELSTGVQDERLNVYTMTCVQNELIDELGQPSIRLVAMASR